MLTKRKSHMPVSPTRSPETTSLAVKRSKVSQVPYEEGESTAELRQFHQEKVASATQVDAKEEKIEPAGQEHKLHHIVKPVLTDMEKYEAQTVDLGTQVCTILSQVIQGIDTGRIIKGMPSQQLIPGSYSYARFQQILFSTFEKAQQKNCVVEKDNTNKKNQHSISTSYNINSFFIPNNSVSKPIDIYFKDENDADSFYDKDDACMRAAVRDYTAGTFESNSAFHLSGPQVILFLNDFKNISLRLHISNTTTCSDQEKDSILVKCAMQSILSKLANNGFIEKTNLLLQVRPRGTLGGPLFCMELNPDQQGCPLMSRDTIITHTYAYLSDERMCIFLNRSLLNDHILKIKNAVLALTTGNTQCAIEEPEPPQIRR